MKIKSLSTYLRLGLILNNNISSSKAARECQSSCDQAIHSIFLPMTCGQNLYTQYHKLLFPDQGNIIIGNDECYEQYAFECDLSATYRYIRSKNGSAIAQYLWNTDNLIFQGSNVVDRSENALIAEYFGMAPDTNIMTTVCPKIQNQVLDLQLELSGENLWFQINIPLMWSKWQANKKCGTPNLVGSLGGLPLDGGNVELSYSLPQSAPTTGVGNFTVNDVPIVTGGSLPTGYVWFDNMTNADIDNSLIGQIESQNVLPVTSTNNASVDTVDNVTTNYSILAGGSVLNVGAAVPNQSITMGIIPMGLYAPCQTNLDQENVGAISLSATVEEVAAINNFDAALGKGYPFGFCAGRRNNNFNFNPCSKFNVADLPMMLGYDFCKKDDYHFGAYIKCVLPTGTKINEDFLEYVLTPVIGNGRHFELGLGVSGHINFACCDETGWGVFIDGYMNKLFGSWQARSFDLPNQPMSRYALVFPVSGNESTGFTLHNTQMVAVGDINVYENNVSGFRGEFIVDCVYACKNIEVGIGYAFAGQSEENFACNPCGKNNLRSFQDDTYMNFLVSGYGVVGQALQHQIGVSVMPPDSDQNTAMINNNYSTNGISTAINVNFFDLGATDQVAVVGSGESAAYSYGTPDSVQLNSIYTADNILNNTSGLMGRQILNRIFGHIDYVWRDCAWQPECGLVGSIGFSPYKSLTAAYWDLGARIGCAF